MGSVEDMLNVISGDQEKSLGEGPYFREKENLKEHSLFPPLIYKSFCHDYCLKTKFVSLKS